MHSRAVQRVGSAILWWRARRGYTLAGAISAAAVLLLFTGCSSVPESSANLPVSPSHPYVPAAGQAPLQLVVNFLSGPYPSDGGSVSVQRTDSAGTARCGATPCIVVIGYQEAAGYSGVLSLPVGAYVVTYEPPDGYHLADGVVNPRTVTVPNPPPSRMLITFTVTP